MDTVLQQEISELQNGIITAVLETEEGDLRLVAGLIVEGCDIFLDALNISEETDTAEIAEFIGLWQDRATRCLNLTFVNSQTTIDFCKDLL